MKKIAFDYLNYLTDDFGIWQHTLGNNIDKKHGYALDDSARALLLAIITNDNEKINTHLNFLNTAIKNDNIINFFDEQRNPLSIPWSEDAAGESYWALAELLCRGKNPLALEIIQRLTPYIEEFQSVRGRAYALIGASKINLMLANKIFVSIEQDFIRNKRSNWNWIENHLSYANAIIPLSLLEYADAAECEPAKMIGLLLLDFLNRTTKVSDKPIAIGSHSWFRHGLKKSIFDQQPIDPAYQVLANTRAFEISQEEIYLKEARLYFSWFWGNNIKEMPLINLNRCGCFDGLRQDGLSKNMGAECIVCYLLAQEKIWPYLDKGADKEREKEV